MQATCPNGHEVTIQDPADDALEYTYTESFAPEVITYADGSTDQVERRVKSPVSRRIVIKCDEPTPTSENPKALCGLSFVITQDAKPPADTPDE